MVHLSRKLSSLLAVLALALAVGCAAQYRNHGYVPLDEDLRKLTVGVDTRATVDDMIGAPSTSGVLGDGNYYYVRSRVREYGAFRPEVISRQVLAISFNQNDTIRNIERFDLQDGRVVPLSRRVTDNSVVGNGFFRQILGNFGNLDPSDLFN